MAAVLVTADFAAFEPVVFDGKIIRALVGIDVELGMTHIPHYRIELRIANRFHPVTGD